MLRQLLSTTNNGITTTGSGNAATTSDYEHYSSTYPPLINRNFENSTIILPQPSSLQLSSQSQQQQQQPISSSSSSSLPSSLPVSLSSSTSSSLQSSAETISTVTSQNQFRIDNDKNLTTLEYMSLAAAGYNMSTPITSNHLGILDTNNDLNDTTELFSSTYAMLSADSNLSWNVWDEQMRFSNNTNNFTANEVPMSINNHDFAYPVHTTTPGCSNNIRYQIRNTGLIDNNYTINCQGLINGNRLELQQQQQQQQPIVVPNNNDIGNRNYNQNEKYGENLNQIAIQSRFSDSNQQQFAQTTISTGRNYLDQMGGFVENIRICDQGNNMINSNVIDPVCPYCDRFISHYKGNIRRHINQCMKSTRNGSKLRRKDSNLKQFTSDSFQFGDGCNESMMTFSDIYQPNVLETSTITEKTAWMDNCSSSSSNTVTEQQHLTVKTKSYSMKKDRSNDDPFRCPLCDFATIYKGNMKRHLSTCHGLQDDDLKDTCIDKLKYKEMNDSRLENSSRNKRSKNLQYLKFTPKLAQKEIDNGPSSSTTTNCNTLNISSEITTNDQIPSTYQIVSSFNNCKEEIALSMINSSNDCTRMEVKSNELLSETIETSSNDSNNQIMRMDTIDETIEAVIANGNENSSNEIGRNNNNNNKYF